MKAQTMKAATAAKKLGILLSAAPEEFRDRDISRTELDELNANPPAWLVDLRADGPHPRDVVARKLGVSNSGLAADHGRDQGAPRRAAGVAGGRAGDPGAGARRERPRQAAQRGARGRARLSRHE